MSTLKPGWVPADPVNIACFSYSSWSIIYIDDYGEFLKIFELCIVCDIYFTQWLSEFIFKTFRPFCMKISTQLHSKILHI